MAGALTGGGDGAGKHCGEWWIGWIEGVPSRPSTTSAKPRVYVETSIVSYLTARPARDIVIAGRQQATRDWWETAPTRFELVVSPTGSRVSCPRRSRGGADSSCRARTADSARSPRRGSGAVAAAGRFCGCSETGGKRRDARCHRRSAWRRVSGDLELPPHCERRGQAADRVGLPSIRRGAPGAVHS